MLIYKELKIKINDGWILKKEQCPWCGKFVTPIMDDNGDYMCPICKRHDLYSDIADRY
jgi:uncharacterized Zn finger protein (UPF0148 family)